MSSQDDALKLSARLIEFFKVRYRLSLGDASELFLSMCEAIEGAYEDGYEAGRTGQPFEPPAMKVERGDDTFPD